MTWVQAESEVASPADKDMATRRGLLGHYVVPVSGLGSCPEQIPKSEPRAQNPGIDEG